MNRDQKITKETILQEALNQLEAVLGIGWKAQPRVNKKRDADEQLVILKGAKVVYRADTIIQPHFKDEHIARNLTKLTQGQKAIVIAEYIPAKTRELLRQQNIDYIDVNGNCFINAEGPQHFFAQVEGRKNEDYRKEKVLRPFGKAGLKVTYQFLNHPELINAKYRDIAEAAGVALGNITHIIDGLAAQNFVRKKNKNEFLIINYDELLDTWVRAYGEKLRPTLEVGTFRFLNKQDQIHWKDVQLNNEKTCWGGEPAAALWTNYLRPEIITVYTTETKHDLMRNYKFIPDPDGPIKAYRKFWKEEETPEKTDAILTYADLILTQDGRCLETANIIYDKFISENLQRA